MAALQFETNYPVGKKYLSYSLQHFLYSVG